MRPLPVLWLSAALSLMSVLPASARRALFDNAHGEQAGNADWVIDDQQPTPRPSESGIERRTDGEYWTGAISTWGVELVKQGFSVSTNDRAFTFGDRSNPLDLANFDVVVVPEPNRPFTGPEARALFAYVKSGGGLVAVGDHDRSDRDRDGEDSPRIWNALDPRHELGVHWGSAGDTDANITQTSRNVASDGRCVQGPAGRVSALEFHNGTTFTLDPRANPSVRGEVWMSGVRRGSPTRVMAASSTYGKGRVAFIGDSSVVDDGSATPNNRNIYPGWTEAGGSNGRLALNATLWAARKR
ncbi:MAG: DUF4350 domain-containing protein [Candidatus Eisenbacteria bacterium]